MTSPMYCSGTTTSFFMIGSRSTMPARFAPSWKQSDAATSNACALESTSW